MASRRGATRSERLPGCRVGTVLRGQGAPDASMSRLPRAAQCAEHPGDGRAQDHGAGGLSLLAGMVVDVSHGPSFLCRCVRLRIQHRARGRPGATERSVAPPLHNLD
ncbi:hypothetical protein Salmuc_04733 [Salipiger mucosus DSM 16094]|uniref:Uncharacterized protein n=1 Tax=Salipiger mucosus DSM 16094 TaxID=1123237 RepID=S9RZW3_9RHOB|nr:hypothetical protein Salmuc_04733 [Salipiger mucosus DSM 16094]